MKLLKDNEYGNVNEIGNSFKDWNTDTEKYLLGYYHKAQTKVAQIFLKQYSISELVDLGCGEGHWFDFYKKLGIKKLIGIDISKERLKIAKKVGYDILHCCNAYELPFKDNTVSNIVSNNMILHVLDDEDRNKIFQEIKRVLKKDGFFLFSFPPSSNHNKSYFKTTKTKDMQRIIEENGLCVKSKKPVYFTWPLKGAHPKFAKFSSHYIFPITDNLLKFFIDIDKSKLVYFLVTK